MAGETHSCTGTTRTWMPEPRPRIRLSKIDQKNHKEKHRMHLRKSSYLKISQSSAARRKVSEIREPPPENSVQNTNSPMPISATGAVLV